MNVLLYVIDCLRSDHLSCYGYSRETTPHIDAVADDGIRYERCFTPTTWTRPASVSLLTGMYPPAHGVRHRESRFPRELERLPQSLAAAGFDTLGVSTMGNVSSALGYDVGFDTYHDLYKNDEIVRKRTNVSTEQEKLLFEDRERIALPRAEDITEHLTRAYENADADDDLFSFCWGIDLHMPLDPPESHRGFLDSTYSGPIDGSFESLPDDPDETDRRRLRDLYDAELRYTDEQFGNVVQTLKSEDTYDESLIIVVGDHGEAFGEHGTLFHGGCPYDELLHVPLVIKPPDSGETPETVSDLTSLIDIYPTVLEALEIEPRPEHVQGQAVRPFGTDARDTPVYSETQLRDFKPAYYSVRTDRWKYIDIRRPSPTEVLRRMYAHRESLPGPRFVLSVLRDSLYDEVRGVDKHLYDVETDPDEQRDLSTEQSAVAERLERHLDDWLVECDRVNDEVAGSTSVDIDAGTQEQLKQLGYTE